MKRTFVGLLLAVYIGGLAQPVKAQTKDNLKGEISLSGAFALYPMVVKWAEENIRYIEREIEYEKKQEDYRRLKYGE